MRIIFERTFRSTGKNNPASKGKLRFSYKVAGTKDEMADFKESRGDFYLENEDGTPLFNALQYVGKSTNLIKTQDGRYIADTSAIDTANSLAEQFPFLASELAKDVLSKIAPSATAAVTQKVVANDLGA